MFSLSKISAKLWLFILYENFSCHLCKHTWFWLLSKKIYWLVVMFKKIQTKAVWDEEWRQGNIEYWNFFYLFLSKMMFN